MKRRINKVKKVSKPQDTKLSMFNIHITVPHGPYPNRDSVQMAKTNIKRKDHTATFSAAEKKRDGLHFSSTVIVKEKLPSGASTSGMAKAFEKSHPGNKFRVSRA